MIAWPLSTVWHEYEYLFSVRKQEHRDRYFVILPPGGKFPDDSGITSRELGWDGQFFTSVPSWLLAWSNPAIIIYPFLHSALTHITSDNGPCFSELRGRGRGPPHHWGHRQHDGGAGPGGDPQVCRDPALWLQGTGCSLVTTGHIWPHGCNKLWANRIKHSRFNL